jgi:hypothetical protein
MVDAKQLPGLASMSRDQLLGMMTDLTGVRSVELKLNIPADQRMALRRIGIDPLEGKIREVTFFDTPDLTLFHNGVVVRARRTQNADDDTVVKLRPVRPSALPPKIQASKNLKVEMDVTRGSYVVSASLKGSRSSGAVLKAIAGERPLEHLFSKEQRAFFADHSPGVGWDDLMPLGPIYITLLKFVPSGFGRRVTLEQWHYPGEVPLVEMSTKTTPDHALQVASESVEFLTGLGLSASGTQEPKTRKALEFYAPKRKRSRSGRPR